MKETNIVEGITAIGVIITTLVSSYLTYRIAVMHKQFNSKMDQALETKQKLGNKEGREELLKEQADEGPSK